MELTLELVNDIMLPQNINDLIVAIRKYLIDCQKDRLSWNKIDKSPVTVADIGVQIIFNNWIKTNYENDSIIAEESVSETAEDLFENVLAKLNSLFPESEYNPQNLKQLLDFSGKPESDCVWYLDPIDGTKGYLRNEQFAVAISRVNKSDEVVFAMLICPNLPFRSLENKDQTGTVFYLKSGQKVYEYSYENLSDFKVVIRKKLSGIVVSKSVEKSHGNSDSISFLSDKTENTVLIEMDSQAKYGLLIRGESNLYIRYPSNPDYKEKWWDHVAGMAMLIQVGGNVTDIFGNKRKAIFNQKEFPDSNGVVASVDIDHQKIIGILQEFRKI